jgi:hypothetical protein
LNAWVLRDPALFAYPFPLADGLCPSVRIRSTMDFCVLFSVSLALIAPIHALRISLRGRLTSDGPAIAGLAMLSFAIAIIGCSTPASSSSEIKNFSP